MVPAATPLAQASRPSSEEAVGAVRDPARSAERHCGAVAVAVAGVTQRVPVPVETWVSTLALVEVVALAGLVAPGPLVVTAQTEIFASAVRAAVAASATQALPGEPAEPAELLAEVAEGAVAGRQPAALAGTVDAVSAESGTPDRE